MSAASGGRGPRGFEPLGGETLYDGRLVEVRSERFRHADGEEVTREIVRHQGAVAVVARDEELVWLVRQPREAVMEPDLLELPAGRLDVLGEEPLAAAQRELAEEIGLGARRLGADPELLLQRRLHRRAGVPVPRTGPLRAERRGGEERSRLSVAAGEAPGRD